MKMKIQTILTLLLGMTSAHAQTNFLAVDDTETRLASCLKLSAPSEEQMIQFLESKTADLGAKENATFANLTFKNEIPEMISWFAGIHKKVYFSDISLDGPYDPKLPATSCTKVLCAMEHLYGKKNALPMLYIFAKFGLSTSQYSSARPENYQTWKPEELKDVMIALEAIPPQMLPIEDRHLLHFLNGYTLKEYGADSKIMANSSIEVFDLWDRESKYDKVAALIHELGHVIATEKDHNFDNTPEWRTMPNRVVSLYAKTSPAEDFAESFLAYRIAPKKLLRISPRRYEYLKEKVFAGLEFIETQSCELPFKNFEQSIQDQTRARAELKVFIDANNPGIRASQKHLEETGWLIQFAWKTCLRSYLNEKSPADRDTTNACLANVYRKRAVELELRQHQHEDYKFEQIPIQQIQDIEVSRQAVSRLRNDLRRAAAKELRAIYDHGLFMPSARSPQDCPKAVELDLFQSKETEITKKYHNLVSEILIHACELNTQSNLVRQFIGPDFHKILAQ